MRHAPPAKQRIKDRARAEAIAKAAANARGPLGVTVEHRRQAPPRLFDLPSLQKTCGQRWGWTADKTLAVAQELYDGDGKKLITYPRAEARYLSREPDRRRAGHCRRADAATRLRPPEIDPAGDPAWQIRPFLRQGARGRVASCHRPERQCPRRSSRQRHRPPQRRREAAVRPHLPLLSRRSHARLRIPPDGRHHVRAGAARADGGRISGRGAHSAGAGLEGGLRRAEPSRTPNDGDRN